MSAPGVEEIKALLRAGRVDEAWGRLQGLQRADASSAELWYLRSVAARQLGNGPDAQESIDVALALESRQPYFHLQAARVAADRGDHEAAISRFRAALARQPEFPLALSGLGASLLAVGRHDEARDALHRHVALGSASALALFDLARLEFAAGRLPEALAWAQRAGAGPSGLAEALLLAGDIHHQLGEVDQALDAYRAADRAQPANPRGALATAILLREQGRLPEAAALFADCARRHPGSLRAALGHGLSLPPVYASADDLEGHRSRYREALGALAGIPPGQFRKPVREFLQDLRWTNFLLAYQGRDDRDLQSAFGDVMHAAVEANAPEWLQRPQRRSRAGGKRRVGFASHFFYDCTAGRYFSPWVLGLDRERFDVFVYYTNARVSPNTQQIMDAATGFRHMPGAPVLSVAECVRRDALDVLIYPEIGMHPDTLALACLRLAPTQCAAWGHPTTTGLQTIDWYLSCEAMEPDDPQRHYRERLALLPGLGTAYAAPEAPAPATRADVGLPEGKTLYLIPQSAFKIHPDNDDLIASVLAADPDGVAVMFAADAKPVMDALVQRLKPAFERRGLSTRRHLVFLPAMAHDVYLAVNRHCDVMLDTLHWSGGNTALDALSVGLPIVTLPGALMRGRQSSAMLRRVGMEALIASDGAQYVHLAAQLGRDGAWRSACRGQILAAKPALFDDLRPIRALNDWLGALP